MGEASIKAHPAINDCAVVGAADPVKGMCHWHSWCSWTVSPRSIKSLHQSSSQRFDMTLAPSQHLQQWVLWHSCQRHVAARFCERTSVAWLMESQCQYQALLRIWRPLTSWRLRCTPWVSLVLQRYSDVESWCIEK